MCMNVKKKSKRIQMEHRIRGEKKMFGCQKMILNVCNNRAKFIWISFWAMRVT